MGLEYYIDRCDEAVVGVVVTAWNARGSQQKVRGWIRIDDLAK